MSGAVVIDLDASRAVGPVNQAPIGRAAAGRVERDRREPVAVVGLPLVHAPAAVAVFFGRHEHVVLEAFDARHLAVAARRDLDALDRAVGARIRPGVFLAVVGARKPGLLELLVGAVVLPAIDRAVLVFV